MSKQLHLGAIMRPVGIHTAWWRYPGAYPDANFNLTRISHMRRDGTQSQVVTLHYQGSVTDDMQSAGF
jgi:hypothetical protein